MDTSTHIVMGLGLGALAHLSPAVQQHPELAAAIMLCTILGSNAPDFDYIFRLKSNGDYIRQHRGLSHSLFAIPIWAFVISILLYISFPSIPFFPVFIWTFVAVILHVIFDVMNFYGTQAMRPFTNRWISLNFIPLFDPFIFLMICLGFVFNFWSGLLGVTFLYVWIGIGLYCVVRHFLRIQHQLLLKKNFDGLNQITLLPTCYLFKWNFIIEKDNEYVLGTIHKVKINEIVKLVKEDLSNELIEKSKLDKNAQHFFASTDYAFPIVNESLNLVEWFDLRYRKNEQFPFKVKVFFDNDGSVISSTIGYHHDELEKYHNKKTLPVKIAKTVDFK